MERDLHDGAQQRILAIALQLRSARVNGDDDGTACRGRPGNRGARATVQELRDLASGLQPAALAGGGLRAATEELASRIPVRMQLDVVDRRFPATVESAAWFVIAEAVSNAVKHAGVDEVDDRGLAERPTSCTSSSPTTGSAGSTRRAADCRGLPTGSPRWAAGSRVGDRTGPAAPGSRRCSHAGSHRGRLRAAARRAGPAAGRVRRRGLRDRRLTPRR